MESHDFHQSFVRAWTGVVGQAPSPQLLNSLLQAYSEPHRRYHTLQHLGECLCLLQEYRSLSRCPDHLEVALWFHDAVYNPKATNNEELSAAWAESALRTAGVLPEHVAKIRELILATDHRSLSPDPEAQLIVDIDLAILGADPERYNEYELQIREEYAWVPEQLFREKRADILGQFLGRKSLYHYEVFHRRFDSLARQNLVGAIKALRGSESPTGPESRSS